MLRRTLALVVLLVLVICPVTAAPVRPVFSHITTDQKVIALTLDDGWCATTSEAVRLMLKEADVRATIFPVGRWALTNPELIRRFVEDGHEIGNHSFNHPNLTTLSLARQREEIEKAQNVLADIVGDKLTPFFRPPYGAVNQQTIDLAARMGLTTILWSVDSWDWRDIPAETVVSRVLTGTRPGSIILMHLAGRNTLAALPAIINDLKAQGYAFVTVSELLSIGGYGNKPSPVVKSQKVNVRLEGRELALSPEALLIESRTFVPFRSIMTSLDYQVQWHAAARQAIAFKPGSSLAVWEGRRTAQHLQLELDLEVAPLLIGGTLYVPLRPIADAMGYRISWESSTRSVNLIPST